MSDDNQEVQPAAKKEAVGTEEEGVTAETEEGVTVRKDQEAKPGQEADMTEGGVEDGKKGMYEPYD